MRKMEPGTRVRMTKLYKMWMYARECALHIDEFGNCVGIVEGDSGRDIYGPTITVYWVPSGHRFDYSISDVEIV